MLGSPKKNDLESIIGMIKILSTSGEGGHGCLYVVIVVCCQVQVSATN